MKYRDILGYKKPKKKLIKEQVKSSKPKVNPIIENIVKTELNEWNDSSFKKLPKRWSKNTYNTGLTEFEKRGGKDNLKEVGAAPLYRKHIKNIEKAHLQYSKAVFGFYDVLRKQGVDDQSLNMLTQFKDTVIKFGSNFKKLVRKLM